MTHMKRKTTQLFNDISSMVESLGVKTMRLLL